MSQYSPYSGQPNPYQNPTGGPGAYGPPPSGDLPVNPLAIISLVTGIISMFFFCCCWPVSCMLGVPAAICGFIGLQQINAGTHSGKGLAIAGIICGSLGVVLAIAFVILRIVFELGVG